MASAFVGDVEYLLEVRGLKPRRDDERAARYKMSDGVGWKIDLPTNAGLRRVDVVLPPSFPFSPARVGVYGMPEEQMPIAHVDGGWLLCLNEQDERVAISCDIESTVGGVLDRAAALLATPPAELAEQSRGEFVNYWDIGAEGTPIVSLLSEATPFGTTCVWNGTLFTLVAASEQDARTWLARRYASETIRPKFKRGVYLPGAGIDEQLASAASLVPLSEPYPDASQLLVQAACNWQRELVAIFRLSGDFALVGGRVRPPIGPEKMSRSPILKGFRKGKAPSTVAAPLYYGKYSVFERARLQRADAPWVLARGGESFDARLQAASVCLIGAGALGSGVARLLVKAGVGRVRIIDPDDLRFDNIARHDLGADHIGEWKAKAVATTLMRAYPFAEVQGENAHWQAVYLEDTGVFECDLVLSTSASWSDEALLNALFRAEGIATPLAFAWVEAYASAAHMLVTMSGAGCMQCGFNAKGEFIHAITEWDEPVLKSEPSCGNSYAPYSNLAATRAQAMIVQQAIAVLKGDVKTSQLTSEIYDKSMRVEHGGNVTKETVQRLGHEPSNFVERLTTNWPKNPECSWCRK